MPATAPKHIIYLRPDAIGDAVLSAGMLPALRAAFGDATRVTVVCQERVAGLYANCGFINGIVTFDHGRAFRDRSYAESLVGQLRSLGADVCLHPVFSRDPVGDFLAINSGCAVRIAHAGDLSNLPPEVRESNEAHYTHLVPSDASDRTELQHHQRFVAALGIHPAKPLEPMVWPSAADAQFADEVTKQLPLLGREVIALAAAGLSAIRFYPHYGAALRSVVAKGGFALVALGSDADREPNQAQLDAAGAAHLNLCGQTTLLQSAEIIRRCRLHVGAESAAAHMACAVGTANVVLLGGGHFGRFFPYSPLTIIAALPIECYGCNWNCRYERPHCIRDVRPEVLELAIQTALSSTAPKPRVIVQDRKLWPADPLLPRWGLRPGMIDDSAAEFIVASVDAV